MTEDAIYSYIFAWVWISAFQFFSIKKNEDVGSPEYSYLCQRFNPNAYYYQGKWWIDQTNTNIMQAIYAILAKLAKFKLIWAMQSKIFSKQIHVHLFYRSGNDVFFQMISQIE